MPQVCLEPGGLPQAYRIAQVIVENPTVRSFVLDGRAEATPGQFAMVWLPGLDEKPFSFTTTDPITLTVNRVGPFTTAMHGLSAGDRVWLRGPLGRGFTLAQGPLLLVSGGCGAVPLFYLAQVARHVGREVHVVLGARTAQGLFFEQRLADLGCTVATATDDGTTGEKGTAIDLAEALLASRAVRPRGLYACGPEPMLRLAYELGQAHGLPCQLSYEEYMRCGIGVCGSCARGGCLVCRDGPVFGRPPDAYGATAAPTR